MLSSKSAQIGSGAVSAHGTSPDPLLTANLFCAGGLDHLTCRLVAPFWQGVMEQEQDAQPPCLLWLVRYPRRGEHLKLRIHAPEAQRNRLRDRLEAAAAEYFSALPAAAAAAPAPARRGEPAALDEEDEEPGLATDRSLLWTHYRRSRLLMGEEPLLDDDRHVSWLVHCFAAGCERVLSKLRLDENGALPHGVRQAALLDLLVTGLAAAFDQPEDRRAYLGFHRDWIVRYPVLVTRSGPEKAQEVFALLDRELESIGAAALENLRRQAEEAWTGTPSGGNGESLHAGWRDSLSGLRGHLARFRDDAEYAIDPFARGPLFPALFKVFHQVANQLGVKFLDEAFAHHLLLRAVSPPHQPRTFTFVPAKLEVLASSSAGLDSGVHTLSANYPWNFYVALASDEGNQWVARFFAAHREPITWAKQALDTLRAQPPRRDRFPQAAELLERADRHTRALAHEDPVSYGVFGRFYHGTVAYYHYCGGDFARAAMALDEADSHLVAAVDAARFLLPAIPLSADIPLQKARIARRQRLWHEMAGHLQALCDVQAGRRPLCVLRDGTEVDYDLLGRLYASRLGMTAEEQRAVKALVNLEERLHWANRRVQELFAPAHLLISYRSAPRATPRA